MKVRPRQAADQPAARAFLARHHTARAARLGQLLDPLDHPAFLAEADSGHLAGMLTYVPDPDWRQCEILTIHAAEQWQGSGNRPHRGPRATGGPAGLHPPVAHHHQRQR